MYIYIYRERERQREITSEIENLSTKIGRIISYRSISYHIMSWYSVLLGATVSFHNFKSQNFKLSVSNPKSKNVAYVSILSHISNCQGLGRKNKHTILKTDRIRIYL